MTQAQIDEFHAQMKPPATVKEEAQPSATPLPKEMTPLEVVQEYVAAMNSDTIRQKLADVVVLSFSGHNHPQHYLHENFEKAAYIDHVKADILKMRLNRAGMRQRQIEMRMMRARAAAPNLHLRAESDDDDEGPPPRRSLFPDPGPSLDLGQLRFLQTEGKLTSCLANPIAVGLILGYSQVPRASGNGHDIEICLAAYKVTPPAFLRKRLFHTPEKEQDTQPRLEPINEEAVAQPSAPEEPPKHRYSLRKRRCNSEGGKVEPKRKTGRHI